LAASVLSFLVALEIAVFGYAPGVSAQIDLQHICWNFLAVALTLYLFSVVSGFAHDIEAGVQMDLDRTLGLHS
jgi:hypothetical protein